jgi:ankyrin repeat protein
MVIWKSPDCQDKNPEAKDGWTPLHWAAHKGHLEVTRLLLQHCQDKNTENKAGETPLHYAALHGHLEVTRLLLQHCQDKNPEDKYGKTPLHYAAQEGHLEVTRLLLQHCQDKNSEDKDDKTLKSKPRSEITRLKIISFIKPREKMSKLSKRLLDLCAMRRHKMCHRTAQNVPRHGTNRPM